jgi:hypothetical protein
MDSMTTFYGQHDGAIRLNAALFVVEIFTDFAEKFSHFCPSGKIISLKQVPFKLKVWKFQLYHKIGNAK